MRYDFDSMQPIQDKVIFALILDKKKSKERIIVGLEDEVKKLLQNENGDVYFDKTSPLGQLLFDFESESADEWVDKCVSEMIQSYRKAFLRAKNTRPVKVFLQGKCDTNPGGKKCRGIQNTYNKRAHDEKLRQEASTVKYETEYGYWNYRMNKLRKELRDDSELMKSAELAFIKFKFENKQWKSDIRNEVKSNKEYTDWLLKQRDVIDDLMDTSF